VRTLYWLWSIVVLVMVVLQIAFAGYGAFYATHKLDKDGSTISDKTFEDGFGIHVGFGYIVFLAVLVLLVLGLIAGIGRWRLGKHGVLAVLLFVQVQLAWIGGGAPVIGALHPLNAFLILGVIIAVVMDGWRTRQAASMPGAQAAPAT
jgi:uncharacterized membrane protein YhaH (DUF805 family)